MVAFTAAGSMLWTVPNDTPQIATQGGGVIGASGTTYDQNGNVTGQIGPLPIYSWKNNTYQIGSIESFKALLLELESSDATIAGGNFSAPGTYLDPNWYPPLPTCTTAALGHPCSQGPLAGDLVWNAYQDLVTQLSTDKICAGKALDWVFSKFTKGDWNGVPITTDRFLSYIQNNPQFLDGTRSKLPYPDAVCGEGFRLNCQAAGPKYVLGDFAPYNTLNTADTVTPSWPVKIFWQPTYTPPSSQGADQGFGVGINPKNSGVNIYNESILFHESLHGMTGLYDPDMYKILPGLSNAASSESISIYIKNYVLGYCPSFR